MDDDERPRTQPQTAAAAIEDAMTRIAETAPHGSGTEVAPGVTAHATGALTARMNGRVVDEPGALDGSAIRPRLDGVHHVKIPVSDLAVALDHYERAFGAVRLPEADHFRPDGELFAYICRVDGLGTLLELRLHPVRALLQQGFDPLTVEVPGRADLEAWSAWLDRAGVVHSPVLAGLRAWIMVVPDPDGTVMRLYTRETHGPEVPADGDSPWLDESVRLG